MKEYAKILIYAMPFFLILIAFEKCYGIYKKNDTVPFMDTIASISSGITNTLKDVLGLSFVVISYEWMVANFAIFQLNPTVWTYAIGFLIIDFYGYWSHRISHEINIFWNKHAIHHSSEEFNLPCALRQPISSFINLFTFLLLPAALLGVPAKIISILLPLHLFLQFWYHTRHINKMGFLEKIIVTPSHHRVHHAINPEYIDKNHSQIFIFWDKLFGTFQEELDSIPPVYGITRPVNTWNPFKIGFQHLHLLILDAWRADNWKDKLSIWFKPTGWRPENFEEKYPVNKITDVNHFEKYGTKNSKILLNWSLFQITTTLLLMTYLYLSITTLDNPSIAIYSTFLFISVYSYTELMDKNKMSLIWESVRFIFGIGIIIHFGTWFEIEQILPFGTYLIASILTISLIVNAYFVLSNFKTELNTTNSI